MSKYVAEQRMTAEQADSPFVKEMTALMFIRTGHRGQRYHRVFRLGYMAALNDVREGRLVLNGKFFELGLPS